MAGQLACRLHVVTNTQAEQACCSTSRHCVCCTAVRDYRCLGQGHLVLMQLYGKAQQRRLKPTPAGVAVLSRSEYRQRTTLTDKCASDCSLAMVGEASEVYLPRYT